MSVEWGFGAVTISVHSTVPILGIEDKIKILAKEGKVYLLEF